MGWRIGLGVNSPATSPIFRRPCFPAGLPWIVWLVQDRASKPGYGRKLIRAFWKSRVWRYSVWRFIHLVSLAQAIDPSHFALLVRIWENTHGRLLASDGQYEVFPALLSNVLSQLAQQSGSPLLFHLDLLSLQNWLEELWSKWSLSYTC